MIFKYSYIVGNVYKEDKIKAPSLNDALDKLIKKSIIPISIKRYYDLNNLDKGKMSKKKVIILSEILINCLESGLPLATIFTLLKDQATKTEKELYRDILNEIMTGNSLATAFKNTEKFDDDFITVVNIGEANGSIQDSLTSIIESYTQSMELKSSIKQAATYPIILTCLGIAMLVFFVKFMIPNLMSIFGDMELPTYTKVYLNTLFAIKDNIVYIILSIVLSILAYKYTPKSPKFNRNLFKFKTKYMPFHKLYATVLEINVLQTLLMFVRSGTQFPVAFATMIDLFKDNYIKEALSEMNLEVQRGESLSEAFKISNLLSPMTLSQLTIAENNGTMETTLANIVKAQKKDVQSKLKSLAAAMEPIFTLIISVVIGSLVIAIMLPMMNMTQNIKM